MGEITKKMLFIADYEIHASIKILYPYINSASGLGEWFADDVRISPEKVYTFVWELEEHNAIVVSHRPNQFTKFQYLPETKEDETDPSYFELRLEVNELTQTTFLKVTDYSNFEDVEDLKKLWKGLIENLKEVVGG